MKALVSVIVPVYKVEDCLMRCLDSLVRQSLHAIEIVLVDDASPDNCGEICEEYATKDARVKVFHHKNNQGLSVARNTGIKMASADYLMFVDSDDVVHSDFCKVPYECAIKNQADLVMFRYDAVHFAFFTKTLFKSQPSVVGCQKTQIEALDLLQGCIGHFACVRAGIF